MEKLRQDEFEFLDRYKDRLISASQSAYINRSLPSAVVHKMREIYSRLIDRPYSMNEGCGSCILTLCRKLFYPYDEYKQTIERNSAGCTTETQQNSTDASGGKEQTGDTNGTVESGSKPVNN